MTKTQRALAESATTIIVTLGVGTAAFGAVLGFEELVTLSGLFFGIWAVMILALHLAFARKPRHIRLSLSVAGSVVLFGVHVALFLAGVFAVDINLVPVIFLDFGMALISLMVLSLVHLVIFKRRGMVAAAAPERASIVTDVPPPTTGPVATGVADHTVVPESA